MGSFEEAVNQLSNQGQGSPPGQRASGPQAPGQLSPAMRQRKRSVEFLRSKGFDSAAMSMMTDDELEQAVALVQKGKSGMGAFHTGIYQRS
jgi:hypothetical protein